jgi:aconitate hydratase
VAAVSLLTGRIEDPREYGHAPELLPMPELRPYVDDVHIFAPADPDEAERIEIPRGPNIKRPPKHEPMEESLAVRVATVQPDDISTGDLAPDGVEVMAYRSNVPAIAEFTLRHRDPEFRQRLKEWGSGLIVAGHNYGQGSSREHAALAPLHLGVKAVIAKSFARIHRRNLVAQGIVALTFREDTDYDKAEVGQTWEFPSLRDELASGAETITVRIKETCDELGLAHDFSAGEREVLVCGGLLSYLRRSSGNAGSDDVAEDRRFNEQ